MKRGSRKNRLLDYWIGTPLLNLLALFHRRRPPPAQQDHIGVICSPALGDTLLFSAALQDLRTALPKARITHLCVPQNLAAAEIIPGADNRIVIDLTRPWSTLQTIRACRFDVLLDFTSWQRVTAIYTLLSGVAYTVGFRTAGQHRSRGYDRTVEHSPDRHEVDNFRALLGESALPLTIATTHPPAIDAALPAQAPFEEEADLVAFHPWASGQLSVLREWPEDRWIGLAQRLAGKGTLFLLTGSPSDRERSESLAARMRAGGLRAEPFTSPDGFRTLAALLRRTRLTVSVNTGVMHLAAILGAPTVSINGPTRNSRWGPVGSRVAGVQAPGPGCPFLNLGFEFDGHPTDCMERITVDAVYAACISLRSEPAISAGMGREASR